MDVPRYPLETPFGPMALLVPSGDFAILETVRDTVNRVNRVEVRVTLRLKRAENGAWEPEGRSYHSLDVHRPGRYGNDGEVSFAAREKLQETLIPLVAVWFEKHPEALVSGQRRALDTEIERLLAKAEALDKERREVGDLLMKATAARIALGG